MWLLGAWLLALGVVQPRRAAAGPLYDQALAAYERVEYADVIRLVGRALAEEQLGPVEVEHAYALLGSALLGDGQTDRADRTFQTLVALRPDYEPESDASPKVIESLKRAHAAVGDAAPSIQYKPSGKAPGKRGLELEADVHASPLLAPIVEYRLGAMAAVRQKLRCVAARCQGSLPAGVAGYRLGFLTPEGAFALPTREYSTAAAVAPRTVAVASARRPIYKRWWLWTVVGVAVVGGVTGAAVGVTLSQRAAHQIDFSTRQDCGTGATGTAACPLFGGTQP